MKLKYSFLLTATVLAFWSSPQSLQADLDDVIISEIQSINTDTIADEAGDYPDWVEFFNAGTTAENLNGCFLTDDPLELNKWRFPSVTIQPGQFLLVFLSDKDLRNPNEDLHTNFKISSNGEFFAFVDPDGETIIHSMDPVPALSENFSYGVRMNATFSNLVTENSATRAKVPVSSDSAAANNLDWTEAGYNDNSWESGTQGVGYDNGSDYDPLIDIDVEDEMDNTNASVWIRIPFEIDDPADFTSFTFRIKYDDGFIAYLNGREIASENNPDAPAAWNARATDDHTDSSAIIFTEYQFANDNHLQAGTNILAIHGLNNGTGSSDALYSCELEGLGGAGELDLSVVEFFDVATPRSGNVTGYPGISPKPTLNPPNQVFSGSMELNMSVNDPEAVIRYTTNRSEPTESSPIFTSDITLNNATFIKAKSFRENFAPSSTVEGTYLTMTNSLRTRSSSVPIVVVDTLGGGIPSTGSQNFGSAFMVIFDRGEDGRAKFSDVPTIANRVGIKERGSSSSGRPKKSYRFEFWDDQDDDLALRPLGLPRESDWILYGAYNFDRAHMRNPFAYEISRQMGRWAARTRFVEVYLNTNGGDLSTSDYWGVYSFMESVKRDNNRVDIERLDPTDNTSPDVEGGYIFKKDRGDPGGSGSFSAGGVGSIQWVYPDSSEVTSQQSSWIRAHLGTVFSTANFMPVIDTGAAIDHHMINAFTKNVDAFRLSGYFHKPRFGKVTFGPVWDFDRSMDSSDGRDNAFNTWRGSGDSSGYFAFDNRTPYWSRWLQNNDFMQLWIDRWTELRDGTLSSANISIIINGWRNELQEAAVRDQSRWNQTSNWQNEVNKLNTWLNNRANWIDGRWRDRPTILRPSGLVSPGTEIPVSGISGSAYYTTDGSDPRRPGGGISPNAEEYTGAIPITENMRIVVRNRGSSTSWSAPDARTFVLEYPTIVITELQYHPDDPDPDSPLDADDFEFVEIANIGPDPIALTGYELAGGIEFTFGDFVDEDNAVIFPDERIVVVENIDAFRLRYPDDRIRIAGEFSGQLNNAGDRVILRGTLQEEIHNFVYEQDWYPTTDGDGPSLSITDAFLPLSRWGDQETWAPSSTPHGTPGDIDPALEGSGGRQIPGDANQDQKLEIGDAITLLLDFYVGGRTPPCEGETVNDGANVTLLDVNGDSSVDNSDAVHILTYLFLDGNEPAQGDNCQRIEGCPDLCRR